MIETAVRAQDREEASGAPSWCRFDGDLLDRVYPVVFIDAIVVKVRDCQVTNRPFYAAIGVTIDGERDIVGIWAGAGGEGVKCWASGPHRHQEPRVRRRVYGRLRRLEGPTGCDRDRVATTHLRSGE